MRSRCRGNDRARVPETKSLTSRSTDGCHHTVLCTTLPLPMCTTIPLSLIHCVAFMSKSRNLTSLAVPPTLLLDPPHCTEHQQAFRDYCLKPSGPPGSTTSSSLSWPSTRATSFMRSHPRARCRHEVFVCREHLSSTNFLWLSPGPVDKPSSTAPPRSSSVSAPAPTSPTHHCLTAIPFPISPRVICSPSLATI
jgi:hypothetical protein